MDTLLRLRDAQYNAEPSNISSPPSSPESPDSSASDYAAERWYQKVRAANKKGHPYELKEIAIQADGEKKQMAQHAQFWPYVGPCNPRRTIAGKHVDFTEWENRIVVAGGEKLFVAQCSDEQPWKPLWDLKFNDDEIFNVAWTFDAWTFHPIIAAGGRRGLVYIIDAVDRCCLRVLRGHGDDILSLSVPIDHPHILASTSSDKTIRIWNLSGSEAPPPLPGDMSSENYPMGDADEGNVCFAILAGEGNGGHRSKVIGCAWHPKHRALATCGGDNSVKIWAIPDFPRPTPDGPPTPRGYRPKVIYYPIFSTNRIHRRPVDTIEWFSHDVLISRGIEGIVSWQWLGYKRFFHPDRYGPVHYEGQFTDYHESHSFMVASRYPSHPKSDRWYMRAGFHRAFHPLERVPGEVELFDETPALVTDFIVGVPIESRIPEIHIYNPALAKMDDPPPPITGKRPRWLDVENPDQDADYSSDDEVDLDEDDSDQDDSGKRQESIPILSSPTGPSTQVLNVQDPGLANSGLIVSGTGRIKSDSRRRKEQMYAETKRPKKPGRRATLANPSLRPWILHAKTWKETTSLSKFARIGLEESVIGYVAISPRGARWIVGVGDVQSVFVFRLKESGGQ